MKRLIENGTELQCNFFVDFCSVFASVKTIVSWHMTCTWQTAPVASMRSAFLNPVKEAVIAYSSSSAALFLLLFLPSLIEEWDQFLLITHCLDGLLQTVDSGLYSTGATGVVGRRLQLSPLPCHSTQLVSAWVVSDGQSDCSVIWSASDFWGLSLKCTELFFKTLAHVLLAQYHNLLT